MIFNHDLAKQAQEVIFSRKTKKLFHLCLSFNNIPLKNSMFQKHLGLKLDVKLNVIEYIKSITPKVSKTMGLLGRFQPILRRSSPLTMYKPFIRIQLDFSWFYLRRSLSLLLSWKTQISSIQCLPGKIK